MTWALGLNPAPTGDELSLYDSAIDESANVIYQIGTYNDEDSTGLARRNLILIKRNLGSGTLIGFQELSRGYQITSQDEALPKIKIEKDGSNTYLWIMWMEQRNPSVQSWILCKYTTNGDSLFTVEGGGYINDFVWDDNDIFVQFTSTGAQAKLVSRNKTTGTENWCVESGYTYTYGTGIAIDGNFIYAGEYDYNSLGDGFSGVQRLSKIYKVTGSSSWTKIWTGASEGGNVIVDSSGDVYWRGWNNILKLDSSGNVIWYKSYSGIGNGGSMAVWYGGSGEDRIIFHKDSLYTGVSYLNNSSQICAIANDGSVVWAYNFSSSESDDRFVGGRISTSDNYILDSHSWSPIVNNLGIASRLQRFDPQTGAPTWTNAPFINGSTQSSTSLSVSVTTNSNPSLGTGANPVTSTSSAFSRTSPGTLYDFGSLGIASFSNLTWFNEVQGEASLIANTQTTTQAGYLLDGNSAITSQTAVTPTVTNLISSSSSIACDAQITPSAGNIVGFPDTLGDVEYVDDDYAGDQYTLNARIYVEEGYGVGGYFAYEMVAVFDRQMRQDLNWDAQTDFLGGYKLGAEADILSTSQSNMAGGLLFDETVSLDSNTQSTFSGGRIRQGDTDLASDFATTGLGGNAIVAQGSFLATTQFSPIGIVEIIPEANILADAQIDITGGYLRTTGALTLGSEGDLTISYDTGTSAGVIIDVESAIASDFAVTETVKNVLDGANNFASDFALTETSGYLHAGEGLLVSEAIWTPTLPSIIEANQMFAESTFATNFSGGRLRQAEADLQAQFITQPEALRIPVPEPYRTYTVKTETRTYTIEQETRVFDVKSETRINNIATESRVYLVPSETRTLEVLPDLTIRQVAGRRVGERV